MRIFTRFYNAATVRKRLDAAHDRAARRADDAPDKFTQKFLLHIATCAYHDARELLRGKMFHGLGAERVYAALADNLANRFLDGQGARVNGGLLLLAFDMAFGGAGAGAFENISSEGRAVLDEFLVNSYNSFIASFTCVIPLESATLIGRA